MTGKMKRHIQSYTVSRIETIAQEFLSRYWDPREQFVNIEAIIERDLGMLIEYVDHDSRRILGSVAKHLSDGRYVIIVNESYADDRNACKYRYTLAQEISHILLHRDLLDSIKTTEDAVNFQSSLSPKEYSHKIESPANRCAGAILMPQHQFREAAYDTYEMWFEQTTNVGVISPEFMQKRVVADLAKRFQVNPTPARIRLQNWPIRLYDLIFACARMNQAFLSDSE